MLNNLLNNKLFKVYTLEDLKWYIKNIRFINNLKVRKQLNPV